MPERKPIPTEAEIEAAYAEASRLDVESSKAIRHTTKCEVLQRQTPGYQKTDEDSPTVREARSAELLATRAARMAFHKAKEMAADRRFLLGLERRMWIESGPCMLTALQAIEGRCRAEALRATPLHPVFTELADLAAGAIAENTKLQAEAAKKD